METNRYTECLPTEPGIYWNTRGNGIHTIAEVYLVKENLVGSVYPAPAQFAYGTRIEFFGPYWAGPICKPEAPEV